MPTIKNKKTLRQAQGKKEKSSFFEAVGRRKTAIARIRLQLGDIKDSVVNNKPLDKYFPSPELQQIVFSPLEKMGCQDKLNVTVKVKGGGLHSQAEALRHGISRALVEFNSELHNKLKKLGFLTRDPRMRERKKFGLKRARRAPQWTKR